MQSFKKIDHSWWLVLTAAALLILGFTISKPSFEGVKGGDLIFWGILSGFIYSLANANDKRAIKGRKPVSEKAIYKNAIDYMALGGLIAIILTWISLFLLYGFFAPKAGYDVNNVMDDIKTAIFLNFKLSSFPVIDEVNIPFSFLGTGFFTIALTLATFKIFELKGLANYAIWLAISMFINLFIGRLAFNENIPNWGLLLFLIFLSFIVFYLQPPDPDKDNFNKINNNDNAPQELPYWAWGIIFVIFNSFREVFVRGSLGGFENPEKIFISFCYRAVYFSTFILLILFRQQIKKLPIINGGNNDDPEKSLMNLIKDNGITLPLATALMLVMVFTLQTPVVASALAIGQISLQIGNIIVVSFVGVLYMTEGRGPTRMGRLKEIFIGNENHGISKFYYLWAYFLFLAIAVMWAIMSIAA